MQINPQLFSAMLLKSNKPIGKFILRR